MNRIPNQLHARLYMKENEKMKKCKDYYVFTWAEPPLEPDENGTQYSEGRCKKRKGGVLCFNNGVYCEGDTDCCDIDFVQALKEV